MLYAHITPASDSSSTIQTDHFSGTFRDNCGAATPAGSIDCDGLTVSGLHASTPIALRSGDVIVAVNGIKLHQPQQLFHLLRTIPAGHLMVSLKRGLAILTVRGPDIEPLLAAVHAQPNAPKPPTPPAQPR